MIVSLVDENGTKYQLKILFWKTLPHKRRRKHGRELIDTTCRIFRGEAGIATGFAKQNALDNYSKIVGKKVALTNAIANIGALNSKVLSDKDRTCSIGVAKCNAINIERRSMRQHIWNVFHETFGRWG